VLLLPLLLPLLLLRLLLLPLLLLSFLQSVLAKVAHRDPEQSEFLQAVEEVLMSLEPVLEAKPQYGTILERMCEPERLIMFRWALLLLLVLLLLLALPLLLGLMLGLGLG
jgi:hypothetical protein